MEKVFEIENLSKSYCKQTRLFEKTTITALDQINLDIYSNEILGIVGESGSGKSTLAKLILLLLPPTNGEIKWKKNNCFSLNKNQLRDFRQENQIILQDPFTSLNSKWTIKDILLEGVKNFHIVEPKNYENYAISCLEKVGLSSTDLNKYSFEFSGGQRQRISIARALAVKPKLIVCDEIVSALDVSVQAQIVNLLLDLKQKEELSLVFISHDLYLTSKISNRILVFKNGEIKEHIQSGNIHDAQNDYTKFLIKNDPRS